MCSIVAPVSLRFSLLIVALGVPFIASAVDVTEWNISEKSHWQTQGVSTSLSQEGVQLIANTEREGLFALRRTNTKPFDALRIRLKASQPMELRFLWRNPSINQEHFLQRRFVVDEPTEQVIELDMSIIDAWNPKTNSIGLGLPPGARLNVHSIEMVRWNIFEKFSAGLKSFWVFDDITYHSINYLWGPQLLGSPWSIDEVFPHNASPNGTSVMIPLLALLAIFGTYCAWRRRHVHVFLGVLFLCWVLLDIRMGSELLAGMHTDWTSYIRKPIGERSLREFTYVPDVMEKVHSHLKKNDIETYMLITSPSTPPYVFARYTTYPILPVLPDHPEANKALYALILGRTDVLLTENGILRSRDGTVYGEGTLVEQYTDSSFLVALK